MAHDLRVGFMRERVFFGYAMADGKDGTPVMKKLKLELLMNIFYLKV